MSPIKVKMRHIKHGYFDKIAGFIKLDRFVGNAKVKFIYKNGEK
jgi:hypothetical protein